VLLCNDRKHFRSWFKIEKLLYQGSRDGFTVSTFHSKCDNKGPTITLVTVGEEISNIHIFGGYNSASWNRCDFLLDSHTSSLDFPETETAFMFRMCEREEDP